MKKTPTLDQIKKACAEPRREWVAVPGWGKGCGCYVKEMTQIEKDNFDLWAEDSMDETDRVFTGSGYRAKLCVMTAEHEDGSKVFDVGDADWVSKRSAVIHEPIVNAAMRLNRLGAKSNWDDEVKNSGEIRNGSLPSGSPGNADSRTPTTLKAS